MKDGPNSLQKLNSPSSFSAVKDEYDIDLDVHVIGKPARYIYRPDEFSKLASFFHVENIKE